MIASHRRQPQCSKQFSGFERPKRTRNVIAEVNCCINAARPNVGDYSFECEQIGVDVGDDS